VCPKGLIGKIFDIVSPAFAPIDAVVRLEVLSLFVEAAEPRRRITGKWLPIWEAKIGADPQKIIGRLMRTGDLVYASPTEAVIASHLLPELKSVAKSRGISTSGTKSVLAARIEAADPKWCLEVQKSANLFICSLEAKNDVLEYKKKIKDMRFKAQYETLEFIRARKFKQANKVLSDFECKQFFSRGFGIDWKKVDFTEELREIFLANPGFHVARWGGLSEDIRVLAAMTCLWGEGEFLELINNIVSDEIDTRQQIMSARMLNFFVSNTLRVRHATKSKVNCLAEILSPHDLRTCSVCQGYDGKRFSLNNVPEVPLVDCLCDEATGCRATISIVPNISQLL